MAPTIHLVRHAQGFHNLSVENESLPDPDLTELGKQQCADLRAAFPHHDKLVRLVASPMRRTLYTGIHSFGTRDESSSLYPVIALDVLQEVSTSPCDTGSDKPKLQQEFGAKLDLSRVRDDWNEKGSSSPFEPTARKLTARALQSRRALREIAKEAGEDAHIAVVSHGGFLHFLTDDWYGIPEGNATGWKNCEYRSYQFIDSSGADEDAALQETQESWHRRQGDTQPPTQTELREMRAVVQQKVSPYLHISFD
ncbi:putative phosphatase [Paramyrothecium foliicola]|nr:putative phosphatase [Paramyrothecium foliicola]